MTLIDLGALRAGFTLPLHHRDTVLAGAGIYAVLFALQSVFTVYAAAGSPGAALSGLVFVVLAFLGFVVAIAAYGRAALGKASAGPLGLNVGADEARLLWGALLILILVFTVLGVAGLFIVAVLIALTLVGVERAGMTEPPSGFIDIFALFGPAEWVIAIVLFTAYGAFSVWFFARLAMAGPATLEAGRIKILSIWPVSHGRFAAITLTTLAGMLPGLAILWVLNAVSSALLGVSPALVQSIVSESGQIEGSLPLVALVAFVYGAAKMVCLAAPLSGIYAALYLRYREENADRLDISKT